MSTDNILARKQKKPFRLVFHFEGKLLCRMLKWFLLLLFCCLWNDSQKWDLRPKRERECEKGRKRELKGTHCVNHILVAYFACRTHFYLNCLHFFFFFNVFFFSSSIQRVLAYKLCNVRNMAAVMHTIWLMRSNHRFGMSD